MDKKISEIAALTERISKDPKSKLFVPLAEEYKKSGDLEMAIHVLVEGLKNNPDYVTARSTLGKFLLITGDIAGAQKEFEEVVKAIPDNLMAQRKLGDIYVIQNRPHDALPHYKTAHTLNPKDDELASLIAQVEADQEVRSKTQPSAVTTTATTAEQPVQQQPSAPAAASEPTPAPVPSPASNIEPVKPAAIVSVAETASPAPDAGEARIPASSVTEQEVPEEILIVEPLEPETPVQEPPATGVDLPGEEGSEAGAPAAAEKSFDFDFSGDSHVQQGTAVGRVIPPDMELLKREETESIPPDDFEKTFAEEIVEAEVIPEVPEKDPERAPEKTSERSDDFTTDTLAELYIAQGFFEKAIEIYERMLADKPNSRGLQEKLARVRAEAAHPVAPAAEHINVPDIVADQDTMDFGAVDEAGHGETGKSLFDEQEESRPRQKVKTEVGEHEAIADAKEYVPTAEPEEIIIEADVLSVAGEFRPDEPSLQGVSFPGSMEFTTSPSPEEQPTAESVAAFDVPAASPGKEPTGPKPQHADFEPREYVPPEMEQETRKPGAVKGPVTSTPGTVGRKETIARLETWLTTIKKEK